MTKGQKIAVAGFIVIVVILVIVLIGLAISDISSRNNDDLTGDDGGDISNQVEKTETETYTDDNGDTVTKETTTYKDGAVIIKETKTDEYGNVTTTDPSLITTYIPYQVMRTHTREDLIDAGFDSTLRYSLHLDEETKTIKATIEYCDVEGDKALVQQYLDSIPVDLSEYTVNYVTFSEDAFCEG